MRDRGSAWPNGVPGTVRDFRKTLEAKREELIRNHFRLEEIASEKESGSMAQVIGDDERKLAEERLSRNAQVLHQVWAALDRIGSERFGRCLDCGGPIGAQRLAVLPWAALCYPCQQTVESRNTHSTRGLSTGV
jgi:DnaK suppressor protein